MKMCDDSDVRIRACNLRDGWIDRTFAMGSELARGSEAANVGAEFPEGVSFFRGVGRQTRGASPRSLRQFSFSASKDMWGRSSKQKCSRSDSGPRGLSVRVVDRGTKEPRPMRRPGLASVTFSRAFPQIIVIQAVARFKGDACCGRLHLAQARRFRLPQEALPRNWEYRCSAAWSGSAALLPAGRELLVACGELTSLFERIEERLGPLRASRDEVM